MSSDESEKYSSLLGVYASACSRFGEASASASLSASLPLSASGMAEEGPAGEALSLFSQVVSSISSDALDANSNVEQGIVPLDDEKLTRLLICALTGLASALCFLKQQDHGLQAARKAQALCNEVIHDDAPFANAAKANAMVCEARAVQTASSEGEADEQALNILLAAVQLAPDALQARNAYFDALAEWSHFNDDEEESIVPPPVPTSHLRHTTEAEAAAVFAGVANRLAAKKESRRARRFAKAAASLCANAGDICRSEQSDALAVDASCALAEGEWSEARYACDDALKLDPRNPLALLTRAKTVMANPGSDGANTETFRRALVDITDYLASTPNDENAFELYGQLHKRVFAAEAEQRKLSAEEMAKREAETLATLTEDEPQFEVLKDSWGHAFKHRVPVGAPKGASNHCRPTPG